MRAVSKSAGGVVLNSKGQVLVVKQKSRNQLAPESWSFPKGRIENGEDTLATARREIYEESGIKDLKLIRLLGEYERYLIGDEKLPEEERQLRHLIFYFFTTEETALKPIDSDNPEARWVNPDEVVNLLTHEKDKEFFKSFIDNIL